MPWERERYPENWSEIASALKETVEWCCQVCGQPCRKQGETLSAFIQRLFPEPESKAARDAAKHPKRYTLTIGHLDQDPQNNHPSNLKAMCTRCHLNYDRPFKTHNRMAKRERQGQINLFVYQSRNS